jgi:hypothetical protein
METTSAFNNLKINTNINQQPEKKILTCLIKDDFTGLLLLYRKLLSTSYDIIGIQMAYDRKEQKFTLSQQILECFPRLAYLGPTPIYEAYVTFANFPHTVDLEDYQNNTIVIDMIENIKNHHIDSIFPHQKTMYNHRLIIKQDEFTKIEKVVDNNILNIALNMFDPYHDSEIILQYDISYCIDQIYKAFGKKINLYLIGIMHEVQAERVGVKLTEMFASFPYLTIYNRLQNTFSEQIATILNSDFLLSGAYTFGFLTYTMAVPTFMIYPFHWYQVLGNARDKTRNTPWYIETTDDSIFEDIPKMINLIRTKKDW